MKASFPSPVILTKLDVEKDFWEMSSSRPPSQTQYNWNRYGPPTTNNLADILTQSLLPHGHKFLLQVTQEPPITIPLHPHNLKHRVVWDLLSFSMVEIQKIPFPYFSLLLTILFFVFSNFLLWALSYSSYYMYHIYHHVTLFTFFLSPILMLWKPSMRERIYLNFFSFVDLHRSHIELGTQPEFPRAS